MASSWTNPLSPRPPCGSFLLVRPHKVSYKVSIFRTWNNRLYIKYTAVHCAAMKLLMHAYTLIVLIRY